MDLMLEGWQEQQFIIWDREAYLASMIYNTQVHKKSDRIKNHRKLIPVQFKPKYAKTNVDMKKLRKDRERMRVEFERWAKEQGATVQYPEPKPLRKVEL